MGAGRRGAVGRWAVLASLAIACGTARPAGADPAGGPAPSTHSPPGSRGAKVEVVSFPDPRHAPVRVVRGVPGPTAAAALPGTVEILSFGNAGGRQVTVVRGPGAKPDLLAAARIETVSFSDPRHTPVTVVRGAPSHEFAAGLFAPATGGELDRIAFAVDGIESRHGLDPGMWRPELEGPQGPMQVSLKAALDVGGGDRFDLLQNRLLGRAYLAQMFRRYGNWPDALAAYNWGPGNLDLWIAAGRPAVALPLGVAHYVERVLRDALIAASRL